MGALDSPQLWEDPTVKAALVANLTAEAAKYAAEEKHQLAEARRSELMAESISFDVDRDRHARAAENMSDYHYRVLPFTAPVTDENVAKAIFKLNTWARMDRELPIEVVFTSPGGSAIDGLALFDHIRDIVNRGTPVTTVCLGLAASMAGILLQAGSHRVMGRESWLMIHEVEFGAAGKYGEIVDMTKWIEAMQKRTWDIFAERSTLTAEEIESKAHRKDWWVDSREALELKLIDEIR
jgi:ATP-dependent Clp endopeptidase proteolytic subunit ClpP